MRRLSRYAASALFIASGFLHFVRPAPFVAIVPPYIPFHSAAVFISGVAELAGGVGLLITPTRRLAAWSLALLLVAVFPANLYMAMSRVQPLPGSLLWARLFLQPLLVWWVLSLRRAEKRV